ncbi:MAG: GNAT family N-acetyltransferase, partial [Arthrobacter sp.]
MTSSPRDRTAVLTLDIDGGTFGLRHAERADLPGILRLLADDQLGSSREDPTELAPYEKAFAAIDADPA